MDQLWARAEAREYRGQQPIIEAVNEAFLFGLGGRLRGEAVKQATSWEFFFFFANGI